MSQSSILMGDAVSSHEAVEREHGSADQPSIAVLPLGAVQHDQEADCFAVLVRKSSARTKKDQPFWTCEFRAGTCRREAKIWFDNRFTPQVPGWAEGTGYRLRVRGEQHPRFGMQIQILNIRPAGPADEIDGYNFNALVDGGYRPTAECWDGLIRCVEENVDDPYVRTLVLSLLEEHHETVSRIQAATHMHHAYVGGLVEHVWSMTRIAVFLAKHYAAYYHTMQPPLNRSVVVAATVLHDIGKLRELEYGPIEARYTDRGYLIGHVIMGRDMVREAARRIEGFPEETLMLLEHAILAHHGKRELGAPVVPQTIEALIVSYVDEMDAKLNSVVEALRRADGTDTFTERVYALDNRRFYRGAAPEHSPAP